MPEKFLERPQKKIPLQIEIQFKNNWIRNYTDLRIYTTCWVSVRFLASFDTFPEISSAI